MLSIISNQLQESTSFEQTKQQSSVFENRVKSRQHFLQKHYTVACMKTGSFGLGLGINSPHMVTIHCYLHSLTSFFILRL